MELLGVWSRRYSGACHPSSSEDVTGARHRAPEGSTQTSTTRGSDKGSAAATSAASSQVIVVVLVNSFGTLPRPTACRSDPTLALVVLDPSDPSIDAVADMLEAEIETTRAQG